MEYKTQFNIRSFEFWGGAKRVINNIKDQGPEALQLAEQLIIGMFDCDNIPTTGDINDYVWFQLEDDMNDESSAYFVQFNKKVI